ncbi:ABC transporter substrate-binding protein [Nonomuraea sp. NPDC005983]|uniref:ABC transporter substrate-binding protein n=1 Tax=Nonomuraea sp. NPDC005983 TaxID=3155595 RepID=UPI0033AF0A28
MTDGIERLRVGACLSLSGEYARFGRQARLGLDVWREWHGAVEVIIEDDRSDPVVLEAALRRLASRCDVLLGPYSTRLMRRAGRVAAALDRLVWNHGGSGDDVQAAHPGYVVSVPTPASRYAEPFVRHITAVAGVRLLVIVQGKGSFGRQVAAGAEGVARSLGVPTVRLGPGDDLSGEGSWNLFCAGSFEEDVEVVRRSLAAPNPPGARCAVAAGVREFGQAVDHPAGIYGVGQWFPGGGGEAEIGIGESDFVAAYQARSGQIPDYLATQAVAAAAIAVDCAELAGSTERSRLWSAACSLETTTLFGAFSIDARSGAQAGHVGTLVRWGADGPAAVQPRA